ncbi:MAG: hypothetical protein OXH97_03240 [Chloroflexota bacterium]|nr:hypothetical protein [Chloroflexota bacterium]
MGAVNIFLGGTGKAVAEDIQDSRDFYGLAMSEPIAFDLNASIRPGVRLDLVAPGSDTAAGVAGLAAEWTRLDTGSRVGPATDGKHPGPQLAPEHSVLIDIGGGIDKDAKPSAGLFALRAHGLAVFSMLFDPAKAMAGTGAGVELRGRIGTLVAAQTFGDQPPRINLVTSTAGGTGAGTVIPLALWLREQYPQCDLNLVAVTPSAFTNVLQGNLDLEELAAKGRSGTFAMLRELSLLSEHGDQQTRFSRRGLPVTAAGLSYRPRQPLFDRVCWFGGRGGDPRDAFEEAGVLLRLLSYDSSADDLAAEMGGNPMQWVGAVTAIEYPKLRYQRRLISHAMQEAYRALHEEAPLPAGATEDATWLLDYVGGATSRPLGAWFHGQRHGALALPRGAPVDEAAATELAGRIQTHAEIGGYGAVARGTQRQGHGYDSDPAAWQVYTGEVKADLDAEADRKQRALLEAVRDLRRSEERAFGEWLADDVLQRRLGGGGDAPIPTGNILKVLDNLDGNADDLHRVFDEDRVFPTEQTVDQCDEEIRAATDRFVTPPPGDASASILGRLAAGVSAAVAFLAVLGMARQIDRFTFGSVESEWVAWIVALAAMFATFRGVFWLLTQGKVDAASEQARRQQAENRLFIAYEQRDRVRALQWLHHELRGDTGERSFFRELRGQIRAARAAVADLSEVYRALEDRATAAVTQATVSPPHVAAEVGDCIMADADVAHSIVGELQLRLRVEAPSDPGPRVRGLRLRLIHADDGDAEPFTPSIAEVGQLLLAVRAEEGPDLLDAQRVANVWSESAWDLINWKLGENLPVDFSAALAFCAGAAGGDGTLAARLQGLVLPKQPSIQLETPASEPARRRVYVGSDAILAEFNNALGDPALGLQAAALRNYDAPRVVPALGEQIVFLDLWVDPGDQPWAPGVIGSATEAGVARNTYYAAGAAPPAATARETCFTVIPELLAATKLELGGVVEPLAPPVVARLLGSDLDTQGPTYAELFYLLRHRGWLTARVEGAGPDAKRVLEIGAGDANPALRLVASPRGGLTDGVFGDGRETVVQFDAFCEFMRFDGTPFIPGASTDGYSYPGVDVFVADWAGDPSRVAALQRAAVHEWYEGDLDADGDAMAALLQQDLERMQDGNAGARSSWERAMRRLIAGPERRAIRATHLDGPSPKEGGG